MVAVWLPWVKSSRKRSKMCYVLYHQKEPSAKKWLCYLVSGYVGIEWLNFCNRIRAFQNFTSEFFRSGRYRIYRMEWVVQNVKSSRTPSKKSSKLSILFSCREDSAHKISFAPNASKSRYQAVAAFPSLSWNVLRLAETELLEQST